MSTPKKPKKSGRSGVGYYLGDLPPDLRQAAVQRAEAQGLTLRAVLLACLRGYVSGDVVIMAPQARGKTS